MGTEYYILKPKTKQIFYLGKRLHEFGGFPRYQADFSNYEDFEEFFWEVLQENKEFFFDLEFNLQEISEILYYIYSWTEYDEIRIGNDCEEGAEEWLEWEEDGSVFEIIGNIIKDKLSDQEESLN